MQMITFTIGNDKIAKLNIDARRVEVIARSGETSTAYFSLPEARTLELLLIEPNKLRTRTELIDYAWAGRPVTAGSLNQAILNLRKALNHSSDSNELIITEPRQGYKICTTLISNSPDTTDLLPPSPEPAPLREYQKNPHLRLLICIAALITINTTIAIGIFTTTYINPSITTTNHLYKPYKTTSNANYFISTTLTDNKQKINQAIDTLNKYPPKSTNLSGAIYINGSLSANNFNFFICDREIELHASNCHSYMMIMGNFNNEKTD